jgi:UDP-glucose 4-epimerase
MRVLVTGGSGFIGSHVVDKLRDHGHQVRVYDLIPPPHRSDVEYVEATILSLDSLQSAVDGVDAVMHLAAVADVKDVFADPHYAESVNVRGTINVLEAMRRNGTVKRMIFGSTTWVYANAPGDVIDETTLPPPPVHVYTATKIAGEHYCAAYAHLYGLEPTILRYGIPYGPRARSGGVTALFVDKALRGEPITLAGDGSQYRKFVYVEDLAEGNVAALAPVAKNRTYNLDGVEKITIRRIADEVEQLVGPLTRRFIEARPGDYEGKNISSERARTELGWEARTSFREGMQRYVDWIRSTSAEPARAGRS